MEEAYSFRLKTLKKAKDKCLLTLEKWYRVTLALIGQNIWMSYQTISTIISQERLII